MKRFGAVTKIAGVLVVVGLALFAASSLLGPALGFEYEKMDFLAKAAGIQGIKIKARNMPVEVLASGADDVTIHYYTSDKDPYEVSLDNGQLTLEYKRDDLTAITNWFFGGLNAVNKADVKVEVLVPAEYAGVFQLDTSNASVKVSGLTKADDIDINTSNGAVTVSDVLASRISARTSNGAVTLGKVTASGAVDVSSSNGALTAKEVNAAEKLRMETSNGRIVVDQVASSDILLESSNGGISGGVEGKRADYTVSSRTSNGDNTLGDGGSGAHKLTVNTSNGSIDIRFLGE